MTREPARVLDVARNIVRQFGLESLAGALHACEALAGEGAVVDVLTPALAGWPGVRVVDTPGLGSAHAHNTEATRAWMPNVAVALVTVSAERPLADEDRHGVGFLHIRSVQSAGCWP